MGIAMRLVQHNAPNVPIGITFHHPVDVKDVPHQPLHAQLPDRWCLRRQPPARPHDQVMRQPP